eukprot:14116473-Alexandrium_andersonii.AAC.1
MSASLVGSEMCIRDRCPAPSSHDGHTASPHGAHLHVAHPKRLIKGEHHASKQRVGWQCDHRMKEPRMVW